MKKGVAGIIENYNGNFLLHLRDSHAPVLKNQWCLIGGGVKDRESTNLAFTREVKEETALDITNSSFVHNFSFNGKSIDIYHCYVDTRCQEMILGEGKELRFFEPLELLKLVKKLPYTNPYLESICFFLRNR